MVVKLKHARITRSVRAGSRIEGQVNRSGALAADVIVLRLEPTPDRLCTYAGDLRVIWPSGFRATAEGTGILDETGRLVYRAGDAIVLGGGSAPPGYMPPGPEHSPCRGDDLWEVNDLG